MQRADGVRARELHPGLGVEHDHAVADARRALDLDLLHGEREGPLGDHLREAVEHPVVGALEFAAAAVNATGDFAVRIATSLGVQHRHALHVDAVLRADRGGVAFDDLARAPTRLSSGRSTSSTTLPTRSCG